MKKILMFVLSLSVVITLSGCIIETPQEVYVDGLNFRLLGEVVIDLAVDDSFTDPGYEAYFGSVNLEDDVEVDGTVDTTIPGIYFLEYLLTYDGEDYTLLRAVVVGDTTVVVDPDEPSLAFLLTGDTIIHLTTVDNYVDPGFEAYFGDTDLEDEVTIEGTVDTNTPGVYFLEYVLEYDNVEYRLLRAVVVSITTEVADPDEVLYDGTCASLDIYYLDLQSMGASTIIDCGDFEIVIDAGLKSAGSDILVPKLQTLVNDGTIELVIATHPDADHIGGFVGLSGEAGVFNTFTVERVLDYGYAKSTTTHEQYAELRDLSGALVCSGDDALNSRNLCQPYYTIMEDLILTVVDTGHYDGEDTTNDNENSVVVMLQHGTNTFLFTGDAEANAEAFMSSDLDHIDVFQAGHHGSYTANTDLLLNAITPTDIILIVDFPDDEDGENGYGIPQQESLDRMFGQTDSIYATGVSGTIVVSSNGTTYTITGTDNTILLKDSDWFSTHRTYPE